MSPWLQITSGQGPAECQWVVAKVVEEINKHSATIGVECNCIDKIPGDERGVLKSAMLALGGARSDYLAEQWKGTIQWIGQSPFRAHHQRKNWFVGVNMFALPESPLWSGKDLKVEVMRGSGPGGQHRNKTSTAVRITHIPTGMVATAQEERSQQQNRKLALARLARLFEIQSHKTEAESKNQRWLQHAALERGNPTRIYKGRSFSLVED